MWNVIEPGDPYDIRKYIRLQVDQWLPSCLDKPNSWGLIYSLFACSRQLKLKDCVDIWMNTSRSKAFVIKAEVELESCIGSAFLWNPNQRVNWKIISI